MLSANQRLKKILKPDRGKIIIFIIIIILYSSPLDLRFYIDMCPENARCFYGGIFVSIKSLLLTPPFFTTIDEPSRVLHYPMFLYYIPYWYFLSCLMASIRNKIKNKTD